MAKECINCDFGNQKPAGKLCIEVKAPLYGIKLKGIEFMCANKMAIFSLMPGTACFIDIPEKLDFCLLSGRDMTEEPECVTALPDEFTHLLVEYEYNLTGDAPHIEKMHFKRL